MKDLVDGSVLASLFDGVYNQSKGVHMRKLALAILVVCLSSLVALGESQQITVAVVAFANLSNQYIPGIERIAVEILSALLAEQQAFKVVERAHVDAIINEIGFAYSGLVDQEKTAISVGRLLGANLICLGSILDYTINTVATNLYGVPVKTQVHTITVLAKFINVETGVIEFSKLTTAEEKFLEAGPIKLGLAGIEKRLLRKALKEFTEAATKHFQEKGLIPGERKLVQVEFDSDPQGASVEIDGIYIGSTPFTYGLEEDKVYMVRITYPGYAPWEMKIKVFEGLRVYAVLRPQETVGSEK